MTTYSLDSVAVAGRLTHPNPSKPSLFAFRQRSLSLSSFSRVSLPLLLLRRHSSTFVALAASREDSHSSEPDAEKEGDEGSQKEWKQALESFKEQALKMQSVSHEAYELYTKKATVLLRETSERLKIHGDKASQDLSLILNEISENTPEPVKEIVETYASSSEEISSFEQLKDFHVGIPYGAGLSVSGIRFGVILGGALLALSLYSLRSWKNGGSSQGAIKGQAAITGILFLRELRLLFQRVSFPTLFAALFSGAMAGTYIYLFAVAGKKPNLENETEN